MDNIYLIGFMGAGKSSVGRAIASITSYRLLDTDAEIVRQEGRTISEIFETEGEAAFREKETACIRRIASMKDRVVSCGGGVVKNPENVSLIRESGTVILLDATPQVILERVSRNDNRPLLKGKKNIESVESMIRERMPMYKAAADLRVRTDTMPTEKVARHILLLVKNT